MKMYSEATPIEITGEPIGKLCFKVSTVWSIASAANPKQLGKGRIASSTTEEARNRGVSKYHHLSESRSAAVYERVLFCVMRLFYGFSQNKGNTCLNETKCPISDKATKTYFLAQRHCHETVRPDGYVDNSPLRSELTTYPQPLLPRQRNEEMESIAQTAKAISTWVIHKQPPLDLCFANPPCGCMCITP